MSMSATSWVPPMSAVERSTVATGGVTMLPEMLRRNALLARVLSVGMIIAGRSRASALIVVALVSSSVVRARPLAEPPLANQYRPV